MGNDNSTQNGDHRYYQGQVYYADPVKYNNRTIHAVQPYQRNAPVKRASLNANAEDHYDFWSTIMPPPQPVNIQRRSPNAPTTPKDGYEFWNTVKARNENPRDAPRLSISGSLYRSGNYPSPPPKQVQYAQPRVEYVPRPAEFYEPRKKSVEYVTSPIVYPVEAYQGRRISVEHVSPPIIYPVQSPYFQRPRNYSTSQNGDSSYYERTVLPRGQAYQTRYGYEASYGTNGVLAI